MQLQASHPKSSCNKGLDKRLYKGNLFLDVYSQFLFTKEVVLSVLYFTSLRTTRAWDVLLNSTYLCRPVKIKAISGNMVPQVEPMLS